MRRRDVGVLRVVYHREGDFRPLLVGVVRTVDHEFGAAQDGDVRRSFRPVVVDGSAAAPLQQLHPDMGFVHAGDVMDRVFALVVGRRLLHLGPRGVFHLHRERSGTRRVGDAELGHLARLGDVIDVEVEQTRIERSGRHDITFEYRVLLRSGHLGGQRAVGTFDGHGAQYADAEQFQIGRSPSVAGAGRRVDGVSAAVDVLELAPELEFAVVDLHFHGLVGIDRPGFRHLFVLRRDGQRNLVVVVVDRQDAVFQPGDGGVVRSLDRDGRIERWNALDLHPDALGFRFDLHRGKRTACDLADQEAGDLRRVAFGLRLEVDGPLLLGSVLGAYRECLRRGQRLERQRGVVIGDLLFDDGCRRVAELHDLVGQREREGFGAGRDLQRDTMIVIVRDDRCRRQLHPVVL